MGPGASGGLFLGRFFQGQVSKIGGDVIFGGKKRPCEERPCRTTGARRRQGGFSPPGRISVSTLSTKIGWSPTRPTRNLPRGLPDALLGALGPKRAQKRPWKGPKGPLGALWGPWAPWGPMGPHGALWGPLGPYRALFPLRECAKRSLRLLNLLPAGSVMALPCFRLQNTQV